MSSQRAFVNARGERRTREKDCHALRNILLQDVTPSCFLLLHPLRAADAMQLAAAIVWANGQATGHEFVCLDHRLREAAQREGFTVLPKQL